MASSGQTKGVSAAGVANCRKPPAKMGFYNQFLGGATFGWVENRDVYSGSRYLRRRAVIMSAVAPRARSARPGSAWR